MSTFAKRLKKERENKKTMDPRWTQGYVADLIGVARTTYTAYENGTKEPSFETLNKLAKIFDVSTDFLIGHSIARTSGEGFFYSDGGNDWTDEEKAAAAAFIEQMRKMKDAQNKDN